MSEQVKADAEAWTELLQSRGWKLYSQAVTSEIASDFENHITKALNVPDSTIALDQMRQIAAVRKAGLRWLLLPQERANSLKAELEREQQAMPVGRRGSL